MIVAAVLVAAGSGVRLGARVPKAFIQVGGSTLLERAVARFADHPAIRDIIVAAPSDWLLRARELAVGAATVPGGASRQESVAAGLAEVDADVDFVLVHDVARAFVPAEVLSRVIAALAAGADAVVPALPVTDTVKRVDAQGAVIATVERAGLVSVQTPQGFRREVLSAAHAASGTGSATDDAALVEASGGRVVVVDGADESFKITRRWDLTLAEAVAARE